MHHRTAADLSPSSKDVSLLTLLKLAGSEKKKNKIRRLFFKWKIKYTEQVIIVMM